ncbi:universal stress protein [Bacillus massiliigorillae]|uniref:universal stress protein n=1 Tax=Bacillus massiliigorillae TaxID=1243664 RepID=UPI00039B0FED|nr:universal stress protein [Bacillus massiliigorillae]
MSEQYKNILVAVDGSDVAKLAFQKAVNIALRNDACLIIAHVVDPVTSPGIEGYHKSILEACKKYGQELLEIHKKEALEAGLHQVETEMDFGSPKAKLVKRIAKKYETDLIVCGAQGLNAAERFVLGSVSEYIVRHASCDVLVVRP